MTTSGLRLSLRLSLLLAASAWLPAATPEASPAPPRRVLAFYYTWYGTPALRQGWRHWDEHGHRPDVRDERGFEDIGAADHPLDGLYDSHDRAAIRRHARLSLDAHLDGWISTWWGVGDDHDQALKLVLETLEADRSPLEVAPYYETCRGSAQRAESDLRYILSTHGSHPRFLRAGGKPVVFVYSRAIGELSAAAWEEVVSRVRNDHPCVLIADSENPRLIASFGGAHNYNPVGLVNGGLDMGAYYRRFVKLCRDRQAIATATVIPGYDDRQVREPGLFCPRRGGETYARLWREATEARPDWILISTFNEWHEGTEIEPSREHGTYYLAETRARAAYFKGFHGPLEAVRDGASTAKPEIRVLAAIPRLEGFPYPQVLLQRDPARGDAVLRNLGAAAYRVSLSPFAGTVLEYSCVDDAATPPRVRALFRSREEVERLELDLDPRAQVHLWDERALERYLERGGYRGDPELLTELREGLTIELPRAVALDAGGPLLAAAPGLELVFRPTVVPLAGKPGARSGESGGTWSLAGDPRITLSEGKIAFSRDLPVGAETGLVLSWSRDTTRLQRRLLARLESPMAIDSVDLRGGRIAVGMHPRFPDMRGGAVEGTLAQGPAILARSESRDGKSLELSAGLEGEKLPTTPRVLTVSWNGVPSRREILLGAEIDLGAGTEGKGIRHVGHSGEGDGRSEPVTAARRAARQPRPAPGAKDVYLYFDLDPAFLAGGPTEIAVEFLEGSASSFLIQYDSTDEKLPLGGAYRATPRVEVGAGGAYRTHAFRIEDAAFRGRQNFGADFRIAASGPLVVARVTVQKKGS